ncbi:regulatory LuxR family protein [Lacinutrix venerupis]|uniref:helix-turn-helix transcriptional regulator n=1 Tax=Lacinutrix venerupis TaxID=1486034 RepID=UPI000EB06BBA|nr:LuxR C-terminal-related transcriptional regulator [Lacinutrix venerupis]RLJ69023.1 regulatory LuxR family protein [Lacinutrix venerupis]
MYNNYLKGAFFSLLFSLSFFSSLLAQTNKIEFVKFIDSAANHIDENKKLAKIYLDSIPKPVDKNIEGRLAEYYQLNGIINDDFDEQTLVFQNFMQALKYAKIEENYDVAGMSSLELFYNIHLVKQDSVLALRYLKEAEKYYLLSNNKNGLAEVKQMPAYMALNNENYKKSNAIIFKDLDYYKSIKDDAYYHMYALFMLTTNYTNLGDINNAHKYFNRLKKLKKNKTIPKSLYNKHEVTLYGTIASFYLKNNNNDSLGVYLQKFGSLRGAMNDYDTRKYFRLSFDYYDRIKNIDARNTFNDSLRNFEVLQISKVLDANLQINNELIHSENLLLKESNKKRLNRYLFIIALIILLFLILFIIIRYKKIKQSFKEFNKRDKEYVFLKKNHEKLQVKLYGLEDYISEVKKEVKKIAVLSNDLEQKNRIKDLYKNIHHNSSTILAKGESHLALINDLNVPFFSKINALHPELNSSEQIICYYLFTGFKNKEIAVFLNTSIRAVESKRYRITKKIDAITSSASLVDYINKMFKETKFN